MGLIPDETISEIRERADIVAVIGQHVELKKAGTNHKGLCPFHQEKSPSFSVNGSKGFYYCFGCQQKGDVFSFVMEYEGKSFVEAAESLAGQLGIIIPETGVSSEQTALRRSEKSQMLEINELATEFFRAQLLGPGGEKGRSYLEERGIGAEQSEAFQLGYVPEEWQLLTDFLQARGADLQVAERLGLLKRNKSNRHYDFFRDRLVCPIANTSGDIVGFSARSLATGDAAAKAGGKYVNSAESALYKKSKQLFGIFQARDAFRTAGYAILVEGNFDVIHLHEHGFGQAIAPLGTAFTDEQALRIKRLVGQAILLYDGDRAGRAATLKALQVLLAQDVSVKIATLPNGEDPDSLVGREGPEALSQLLSRAQPAIEYFIHEVWVRADRSTEGRARTLNEAAQVLRSISDPTQRDFAVGTLATALGVDEATLRRGLRRALQNLRERQSSHKNPQRPQGAPTPDNGNNNGEIAPRRPPPELQLDIICILAEFPELLAEAETQDVLSYLTDMRLRDMYTAAKEGQPMLSVTDDPGIARALLSGAFAGVTSPSHCLSEAAGTLKSAQRKKELAGLQKKIEEAGRRGDSELERQLIREIMLLRKQVD
ncbi:MAG: DNA primase [Myxococcales bacterium]|nr:DNA primase [Myxococcales bacterium]